MKKFNIIIAGFLSIYIALAAVFYFSFQQEERKEFYRNQNGVNSLIKPMFVKEELLGYVRFDYTHEKKDYGMLWLME